VHIIDQLRADLASAHLRQQAARFTRLTVVAFGAQLATLGTGHLGWEALAGVAVGAVEVGYRQWAPTVPWTQVTTRLRELLPGAAGNSGPTAVPGPATTPPATGGPSTTPGA
jgi:hypothetical protein